MLLLPKLRAILFMKGLSPMLLMPKLCLGFGDLQGGSINKVIRMCVSIRGVEVLCLSIRSPNRHLDKRGLFDKLCLLYVLQNPTISTPSIGRTGVSISRVTRIGVSISRVTD